MQGEVSTAQQPPTANAGGPTANPGRSPAKAGGSPALDEATRGFVRRALAAGLVNINDVKKVVVSLMEDSPRFTPKRLAEGLVGAGVLTQWQSTKLLAGKSKGFYLGSYRLLRPLGKGGMGVVYLGEHHVMKRLMALKILPPESTRDERRIERFKEEARACAQLDHPNIVRAYDFAEAGGKLYIVMEYVEGIDVQRLVQRDGVMSFADAMDAMTQATEGLAHAHERGIIHRDIKPSNMLLRSDGVLKVSDLGLARIGWTMESEPDGRHRLMGTADFLAPEQAIDSKTVDTRADIYALACTLFFLLTGRPPYDGETVAKRLAKHQTAPVPDIRSFRSDCPVGIAELVMRMMAKRPEDRPKSAIDLLSQLKRITGISRASELPSRVQVSPDGDTVVDEAFYQATIDDTSLSADGEVVIADNIDEVEEFDFASLPPIEVPQTAAAAPLRAASTATAAARAGGGRKSSSNGRNSSPASSTDNQQLLLGIGLAVAVMALIAVVGFGIYSFTRPLPQTSPKVKATEDGKNFVIID